MPARARLLVVHGLGEHVGRYARLAGWLAERGVAVRAYDQRGHGLTPGRRAVVPDAETPLWDLQAVFEALSAEGGADPLLLGHSMGGAFAARAVTAGRVCPRALILSSPALALHNSAARRAAAAAARRLIPRVPLSVGKALGPVSHDPRVSVDFRADPLTHGYLSAHLYDAMREAGRRARADAHRLTVPTLMLVSGSDAIVEARGSRAFADAAPAGVVTLRWYPELWHELFNEAEPGRSRVLADLEAFLAPIVTAA